MSAESDNDRKVISLEKAQAEKAKKNKKQKIQDELIDDLLENAEYSDEVLAKLEELKKRFFTVRDFHGHCLVGWFDEVYDKEAGITKKVFRHQQFKDFRNGFIHDKVKFEDQGQKLYIPISHLYLSWRGKKQYESVKFAPGEQVPDDILNLWRGWPIVPKSGDCKPILDFLAEVACNNNKEHYEYLLNLLALGVQKPGDRWGVALLCYSEAEGTGKGTLGQMYGSLFGQHFLLLHGEDQLIATYNGHLIDICCTQIDEADFSSDKANRMLRSLITEAMKFINPKGIGGKNYPNVSKLIITSNKKDMVQASQTARRFFCLEFSSKRMQDHAYFRELKKWYFELGGNQAFLQLLLDRDISNFNQYKIPNTDMLSAQKELSMPEELKAILYMLEEDDFPDGSNSEKRKRYDPKGSLKKYTISELRRQLEPQFPRLNTVSDKAIANVLKKLGCLKKRVAGKGNVIWIFPTLEVMRKAWVAEHGAKKWPDPVGELSGSEAVGLPLEVEF